MMNRYFLKKYIYKITNIKIKNIFNKCKNEKFNNE